MRRAVAPLPPGSPCCSCPLAAIEPRTWLTLTVAGLAMGMLIFLVAAGLTLIFGLMDVLNFAHGALFSWGAYAGFSVAVLVNGYWGWAVVRVRARERGAAPARGGRPRWWCRPPSASRWSG